MNCSFIKDLIKQNTSLGISKYYCGKIDNKYEKAICVYDLQNDVKQNIAVGGKDLTTGIRKFSVLVRWNKSYSETEEAAQNIFDYLTTLRQMSYNNIDIKYIELLNDAPIDLHCGDDGIFERLFDLRIYFEEKQIIEQQENN